MPKQQRAWVYSPPKPAKPPVSESVKAEVTKLADALVDAVLKPKYIQPPPAPHEFQHNYLTDIFTKWYRGCFYFCSVYACPGPNALSPSFEAKFARMDYLGKPSRFNLSFMRHTGEWVELYNNLTLDACMKAVSKEMWFHP